jgi:hypothetical protein
MLKRMSGKITPKLEEYSLINKLKNNNIFDLCLILIKIIRNIIVFLLHFKM